MIEARPRTAPRILVIEDEPDLRGMLQAHFAAEGFRVETAGDGETGLASFQVNPPDILVLDLMLPGMDGFEVLGALRLRRDRVPVLILTARGEDADRVRGLSSGADDYLCKPFSMLELVARVRAVLRRSRPETALPRELRTGPYRLDFIRLAVFRGRTDLGLSLREFRILEVLVAHPGRVHSRRELLHMAWDSDARPSPRTVDVHIASLRRKLGDLDATPFLQTLEREGYRWTRPVSER